MPVVCCIGRYIEKIRTLIIGCYSSRNPYYWHFSNYHYIHTRSMLDICKFNKGSSPEEMIELFEHYRRYDSFSDVPENRVCFASKNLTPWTKGPPYWRRYTFWTRLSWFMFGSDGFRNSVMVFDG